jgi:transposase
MSRSSARELTLDSKALGALPFINRFLEGLRLDHFLAEFVPRRDRRLKLEPAVGLGILVRNVLVSRQPLYGLSEWARRFDPRLLGLAGRDVDALNDDRVGRCLDQLFLADRAALMTAVVVHAARTFDLELTELHNDSTTVTFTGQYSAATGGAVAGRPTRRVTFGHNKDHRPDLKQLLWVLTTTADGTVPVWCSVEHGNTTDDQTHIGTWEVLRRLVGRPDFLYVADSKLCTKQNLEHIARQGGRFVTVLPKTRREDSWFRDWLQVHEAQWVELERRRGRRRQSEDDDVYRGFESPLRSVEGYRILWFWSSQKLELDRSIRQRQIQQAVHGLEQLRTRLSSARPRLRTRAQVEKAAQVVLAGVQAERWITVEVRELEEHHYHQSRAGRPGKNTQYVRKTQQRVELHWQSNGDALRYADRTDGIFPLVINDEKMSLREALLAYKHQPSIEKRHEQVKTVLEVMPVNLKSHSRIEAFLFVYFLALLVASLVERHLRRRMQDEGIDALPLYPEGRPCRAPTATRVFELFEDVRRHRLLDGDGKPRRRFYDELTPMQRTVLRLLGLSPSRYFAAGDDFAQARH